jgi:hypothetical protein
MALSPIPRTQKEWAAWERAEELRRAGLPPKVVVPEAERKAKDAARKRAERSKNCLQRQKVTRPKQPVAKVIPLKPVVESEPEPKPRGPKPMGENELAVMQQLSDYAASHPSTVTQAKTIARILDNDEMIPLHPTASRQLDKLIAGLTAKRKPKARGRLSTVIAMTAAGKAVSE